MQTLDKYLNKVAPFIGYMAIEFNDLEETLNTAIVNNISEHDEGKGYIIISGMSFSAKIDLLDRMINYELAQTKSPRYIKWFKGVIQDLNKCNKLRNNIIHGAWLEYNMSSRTLRTKKKVRPDGVYDQEVKIELKDIKTTRNLIEKSHKKLFDIFYNRERWYA
jgi:hypothetical protein